MKKMDKWRTFIKLTLFGLTKVKQKDRQVMSSNVLFRLQKCSQM